MRDSLRQTRAASRATVLAARELRRDATPAQRRLWSALRRLREEGYAFRRQAPLAGLIVDFACLRERLVVEVEGGPPDPLWAVEPGLAREATLERAGFRTLRFFEIEIARDLPGVLRTIEGRLRGGTPSVARLRERPSAVPTGGERSREG